DAQASPQPPRRRLLQERGHLPGGPHAQRHMTSGVRLTAVGGRPPLLGLLAAAMAVLTIGCGSSKSTSTTTTTTTVAPQAFVDQHEAFGLLRDAGLRLQRRPGGVGELSLDPEPVAFGRYAEK